MSLFAFLVSVVLGGAERWVVVCVCPPGHNRSIESRIAVDAGSVDSAGNGIYHARFREGSWGTGRKKPSGVIQDGLVNHPYDRKIWRMSVDCVNRRVRPGPAAFYYGSRLVPGGKPDDAPRGDWVSAALTERDGDLVEAICSFRWKRKGG